MSAAILPLLARRGPMTGGELARQLGLHRTALLRAVRAAGDGRIGEAFRRIAAEQVERLEAAGRRVDG
jgi:transposase-like protein